MPRLKFTLLPGGLRQPGRSKPPPERPAFFLQWSCSGGRIGPPAARVPNFKSL